MGVYYYGCSAFRKGGANVQSSEASPNLGSLPCTQYQVDLQSRGQPARVVAEQRV